MDAQGVKDTIKLFNGPNAPVKRDGSWITTRCPFAPWLHPRGTDNSPSFGIHVKEDGTSIFHCFTCKRKGTIGMLWEQLGELDGNDYSKYTEESEITEIVGPDVPKWENRRKGKYETASERFPDIQHKLGEPISDELLIVYDNAWERAVSRRYLQRRGITRHTSEILQLVFDPDDGHGERRILFPVRDTHGNLYGFTGRAIKPRIEPRIRDYYGLPKRLLLLGAHDCRDARHSDKRDPIILVEGLFDYAKVRQAGFECVASMHSGLTDSQVSILATMARPVVVMYDDDEAGKKGKSEVKKALGHYVRLFKVRWSKIAKPDKRGYTWLDPGKLTTEQIHHLIKGATLI